LITLYCCNAAFQVLFSRSQHCDVAKAGACQPALFRDLSCARVPGKRNATCPDQRQPPRFLIADNRGRMLAELHLSSTLVI
jgi:hypothetical protein